MQNMRSIRGYGGLNKQAFYNVGSDFENIIYILNGINESVSENTFMWMLKTLGISVDEFKTMPNTEEEANEMMDGIKESFIKTFNKILKS